MSILPLTKFVEMQDNPKQENAAKQLNVVPSAISFALSDIRKKKRQVLVLFREDGIKAISLRPFGSDNKVFDFDIEISTPAVKPAA